MPVNRNRRATLQLDTEAYTGFQIAFDVTKTVKSSPRNKARIRIYNLSEEVFEQSIDRRRDLVVRLFAGYEVASLVFTGNPVKNGVQIDWQGADRILNISAEDGYRAYQRARVNVTLDASEATLADVAREAAKQMGIPVGVFDLGDLNPELTQGLAIYGPASRVLDRVAASVGADWSIQNGALQMLPRGRVRRAEGPLYSRDLNNIQEYPKFTDEGLKLKVFLDPSIEPGDRFTVKTGNVRYDGTYRAETVTHSGDLWGGTWTTEIEGKPSPGVTASQLLQEDLVRAVRAAIAENAVEKRAQDEQGWNFWKKETP